MFSSSYNACIWNYKVVDMIFWFNNMLFFLWESWNLDSEEHRKYSQRFADCYLKTSFWPTLLSIYIWLLKDAEYLKKVVINFCFIFYHWNHLEFHFSLLLQNSHFVKRKIYTANKNIFHKLLSYIRVYENIFASRITEKCPNILSSLPWNDFANTW